ncbi:MAG: hypothetical protein AAF642_00605 [Pseudomonadota bacterium]
MSQLGMLVPKVGRIAWLVASNDYNVASARYRAIYPSLALKDRGYVNRIFWKPQQLLSALDQFDAVIVVKRLDPALIDIVASATEQGKLVFLDLCDNILSRDYRNTLHARNQMVFEAIAPHLSGIVTTGTALASQICCETGFPSEKVFIVEDCVETPKLMDRGQKAFQKRAKAQPQEISKQKHVAHRTGHYVREVLSQLGRVDGQGRLTAPPKNDTNASTSALVGRAKALGKRVFLTFRYPRRSILIVRESLRERDTLNNMPDSPETDLFEQPGKQKRKNIVLWFGNHGGPHSDFGMLTLLKFANELRAAAKKTTFTLVVVSNNLSKYKSFIARLGLRTKYVEWSPTAVPHYLSIAKVCVIPTGNDEFSIAKSANRHILALSHGVPVVASPLPSTKPLSKFITSTRISNGISEYLTNTEKRIEDVNKAKYVIEQSFTIECIGEKWEAVLNGLAKGTRKPRGISRIRVLPKVLVIIDLVQDFALAKPIVEAIMGASGIPQLVVSERAVRSNPELTETLIEWKLCPTMISALDTQTPDFRWIRNSDAVLTMSETDQNPHKIAHYITRLAQQINVPTYTIQHGFENIGLTYRDNEYPQVGIASDTIFTWGETEALPEWVGPEIRNKCIPMGRVTSPRNTRSPNDVRDLFGDRSTIGVFENLHWSRYSDEYRTAFINELEHLARSHPTKNFIIKPHPAGMWLKKNTSGHNWPSNVYLTHSHPKLKSLNANNLLAEMDAVITTPSSVALDAAEHDLPTAIVGNHDCDTTFYEPLPILQRRSDWGMFVESISDKHIKKLKERSGEFVAKKLAHRNGTQNIVNRILSDIQSTTRD